MYLEYASSVIIDDLVGSHVKNGFSFDAPLMSLHVYNFPTSGGTAVSVTGLNFGLIDSTASGRIGTTACMTFGWTSNTMVHCLVDSGIATSMALDFRIMSISATFLPLPFTYDTPVQSYWAVSNAPHTGETSLTVLGLNFGNDMGDEGGFTPTVQMGYDEDGQSFAMGCLTTSWASSTAIQCTANSGAGKVQTIITVSNMLGTASTSWYEFRAGTYIGIFTYDAPVISGHTPANVPETGGASVTIWGFNFGTVTAKNREAELRIGLTSCHESTFVTHTYLKCRSPEAWTHSMLYGGADCVISAMTVATVVGTGQRDHAFTYQGIYIGGDMELLNAPITKGLSLTVTGANFAPLSTDATPSVRVADVVCLTTVRGALAAMCHVC